MVPVYGLFYNDCGFFQMFALSLSIAVSLIVIFTTNSHVVEMRHLSSTVLHQPPPIHFVSDLQLYLVDVSLLMTCIILNIIDMKISSYM